MFPYVVLSTLHYYSTLGEFSMKPEVKMEQWSVSGCWPLGGYWMSPNGSDPSCDPIRLSGAVIGRKGFIDGKRVYSSVIQNVQGNRIETHNTIYILGEIDPKYLEWCIDQGCYVPTKDEPIRIISHD